MKGMPHEQVPGPIVDVTAPLQMTLHASRGDSQFPFDLLPETMGIGISPQPGPIFVKVAASFLQKAISETIGRITPGLPKELVHQVGHGEKGWARIEAIAFHPQRRDLPSGIAVRFVDVDLVSLDRKADRRGETSDARTHDRSGS
jgi:hypothetical protein